MSTMKRLLDEPDSDLDRVLLESGLDDEPPRGSLDKTLAAIGVGSALTLAAGSTAVGGATAGAKVGWFGVGFAKIVGGIAVAGLTFGGGYALVQHASQDQSALAPNSPAQEAAGDDRALSQLEKGVGHAPLRELAASLTSGAEGADSDSAADNGKPSKKARTVEKTEAGAPAAREPGAARGDKSSTGAKSDWIEDGAPNSNLGAETALIDQARKALAAGNHEACFARIDAYHKRFPKGQLAPDARSVGAACAKKAKETAPAQ